MGSKKHKKESKKKKHRSRSRSPLDGEERERRRHRKHRDRKKDRSPDVEEVPVDSHLAAEAGSSSRSASRERERDLAARAERSRHRDRHDDRTNGKERSPPRMVSPVAGGAGGAGAAGGGAVESLSVEETNRLRAKLGLKPLEVGDAPPADDGKLKDDLGEFYHRPAGNLAAQRKQDKLRERLAERKEKRKLEHKLATAPLGTGSDDEDAAAWIAKSRDIERQKREAAKRAATLDELDAEFGVSALLAEERAEQRAAAYGAGSLRGLRVAHDLDALGEERALVLTLADRPVLAEGEDELVNVNLLDDERYRKNQEEIRKARAGYQAYEDADDVAAAAAGVRRGVLSKYDDEIDKERASRERGFVLGDEAGLEAARFREMMRRSALEGAANKRLESLAALPLQPARDYMDEREIQAKFKKTKRKGKIRKKPKAEPIDVDSYDPTAAAELDTDDTEVKPEQLEAALEEEEVEVDSELQAALARARRTRLREAASAPKVEDLLQRIKEEPSAPGGAGGAQHDGMVLDATAEFCRSLGDIPTYGQAGNRDSKQEIMDFEEDLEEERARSPAPEAGGAWSRVDVAGDRPADIAAGGSVGLEAEPALDGGVAGALRLALSKGYLERQAAAAPRGSNVPAMLAARHYSIEDKAYGDDSHGGGGGRRERGGGGYSGPLSEFREKAGFRPNVKLDYVDDEGRALCPKEAFRYLSHKFHGKGPGKNKQEKRIKKAVQEGLMKKMSSTDTPLNTLALLQEKQKETHSPFVVLSGAKKDAK